MAEHEVGTCKVGLPLPKMGNVASAASGPQQPTKPPSGASPSANLPPAPPMTAPGPPADKKPENVVQAAKTNPGSFEDLHKKTKGMKESVVTYPILHSEMGTKNYQE